MLQLRYCFDSTDWLQQLQLQALTRWLATHVSLKLESPLPLHDQALYPLFSRPMPQTEVRLQQTAQFSPDPTCANIYWGHQLPLPEKLSQSRYFAAVNGGSQCLSIYGG